MTQTDFMWPTASSISNERDFYRESEYTTKIVICLKCEPQLTFLENPISCFDPNWILLSISFQHIREKYRIWFLSTSGISSCSISQGKIISVNWLLCYRFFLLGTPPSPFQHFNRQRQKTHTFSQQFSRNNLSLKFHAQVLTIVFVFVLQDRNRGLSLCQ